MNPHEDILVHLKKQSRVSCAEVLSGERCPSLGRTVVAFVSYISHTPTIERLTTEYTNLGIVIRPDLLAPIRAGNQVAARVPPLNDLLAQLFV